MNVLCVTFNLNFKMMTDLFLTGGVLFMSLLTIELIGVLLVSIRYWNKSDAKKFDLDLIKGIGLLALVTGILNQLMGLFSAFQAIEQVGSVSPAILAGGLKVSMISTIYGLIIYLISLAIWMALGKIER